MPRLMCRLRQLPFRAQRNARQVNTDFLQFETMDFGILPQEAVSQPTVSFAPVSDERSAFVDEDSSEVLGPDLVGEVSTQERFRDFERKSSLPDRIKLGKKKKGRHSADASNAQESVDCWALRIISMHVQRAKRLAHGYNFSDEKGDDDGFAWKGGAAGGDILEDYNFASESAARIRRKFSESFDTSLVDEKRLVVCGHGRLWRPRNRHEAFWRPSGSELQDAFIINIDCVGTGQLRWYSERRLGMTRSANACMTSLARRATRNL